MWKPTTETILYRKAYMSLHICFPRILWILPFWRKVTSSLSSPLYHHREIAQLCLERHFHPCGCIPRPPCSHNPTLCEHADPHLVTTQPWRLHHHGLLVCGVNLPPMEPFSVSGTICLPFSPRRILHRTRSHQIHHTAPRLWLNMNIHWEKKVPHKIDEAAESPVRTWWMETNYVTCRPD